MSRPEGGATAAGGQIASLAEARLRRRQQARYQFVYGQASEALEVLEDGLLNGDLEGAVCSAHYLLGAAVKELCAGGLDIPTAGRAS